MKKDLSCFIAVCFLVICGSAVAKEIDNPWMKADVGSWVKHKNIMESKVGGQSFNSENTTTITLAEKDKDSVTLFVNTEVGGTITEDKITVPAKSDYKKLGTEVGIKEIGEETIKVEGKEYKCKVSETTLDLGGFKTVTKSWTNDKVPSGNVKSVTTSNAMKASSTLIDYGKK
ncbi:hypothetical protein ACFLQ8_03450 [Candidatus Auribacterota bacterium]